MRTCHTDPRGQHGDACGVPAAPSLGAGRAPGRQDSEVFPVRAKGGHSTASRGSVIIIVLITILFAVAALTLFIEKAGNDLLVDAREADASRMRLEAYSALETTLGVLEDFRLVIGALHSPAEGWGEPLEFAGYEPAAGRTVEVAFVDESAKISLPNADNTTLVELFKSWGLQQSNAERLTDALLGWMKKDYVPGTASAPRAEDYDRGEYPIVPPGRPLRSFDELASIDYVRDVLYDKDGEPNELWARFVEAFSLYQYQKANINGGSEHVLAGLGLRDDSQLRRVQDYLAGRGAYQRLGAGFFKGPEDIATLLGANSPAANLSTQISALRIIVTVREGKSSFRLNAVVAPQGGATIPAVDTEQQDAGNGQTPQPSQGQQPVPTSRDERSGGTKSLNYPFTILEIRENDVQPAANPVL